MTKGYVVFPQVMTVEQIRKLPGNSVVWEEYRKGERIHQSCKPMLVSRDKTRLIDEDGEVMIGENMLDRFPLFDGEYGQRRFWTEKPTKENRTAVKWE